MLIVSLLHRLTNDRMRKTIIFTILFISFSMTVKSQDSILLKKEDVAGRWIEAQRIFGDSVRHINEYQDTYIFRDNMVFHKGEAAEGVILFNITGRYTIEGDSVIVLYKDYIRSNAKNTEAKKLIFKILSLENGQMLVSVRDYDFEYRMVLKKQES